MKLIDIRQEQLSNLARIAEHIQGDIYRIQAVKEYGEPERHGRAALISAAVYARSLSNQLTKLESEYLGLKVDTEGMR